MATRNRFPAFKRVDLLLKRRKKFVFKRKQFCCQKRNNTPGMHDYERKPKQRRMNEFVNIDVLSGLVALKPVGKTYFAPSHTLRFSCSIVRDIWSVSNQRPEFRFGRATRALQQRLIGNVAIPFSKERM